MKIIAKTFHGLEGVLEEEIRKLGGQEIVKLKRAIAYEGDLRLLYKSNHYLRTALKILLPLGEYEVENEDQLYKRVFSIPWESHFSTRQTFSVSSSVSGRRFTHSKYVALKSKDAIVDRFRFKSGKRPNVDVENADFHINIHIRDRLCTVSLDSSGESLHRRGYRKTSGPAPLNEALAAGLVLLSGWDGHRPLYDPMCGSATILIEAALYAMGKSPQKRSRRYSFMNWKTFDKEMWLEVQKGLSTVYNTTPSITGSDVSDIVISNAGQNVGAADLYRFIKLEDGDFFSHNGMNENAVLICNPPYDKRLKEEDIQAYYKKMGDKFKQHYQGCEAWVFSGNIPALKSVGLRPSKKINLFNGPIESGFYKFEMYQGSKEN